MFYLSWLRFTLLLNDQKWFSQQNNLAYMSLQKRDMKMAFCIFKVKQAFPRISIQQTSS
jgi:hypothetical protein